MNKVSLDTIDLTAERLNELSDEDYEQLVEDISNEQETAIGYLLSADFKHITPDEQKLLLYIVVVAHQCLNQQSPLIPAEEETIDKLQVANWDAIDKLPPLQKQTFEEFVEPIIGPYAQDELLYFTIDALEDGLEDEQPISKESRLPIFIGVKTVIDSWIQEKN